MLSAGMEVNEREAMLEGTRPGKQWGFWPVLAHFHADSRFDEASGGHFTATWRRF